MIAALFVMTGGCYFGLPGVDPWDEKRDARLYPGNYPVVAHPPCARWSMLANVNRARYGTKIGDDGGCFASALASVRAHGGVLEHPAESMAWKTHGLDRPPSTRKRGVSGAWIETSGGWTTEVAQRNYGHRANKRTWLYYVGSAPPPPLDWSAPPPPGAWISTNPRSPRSPENCDVEHMGRAERLRTPPAFRDLLISMARNCR